MDNMTVEKLVQLIAKDIGVSLEVAEQAVWSFGEYMWRNSDENGLFYIDEEETQC